VSKKELPALEETAPVSWGCLSNIVWEGELCWKAGALLCSQMTALRGVGNLRSLEDQSGVRCAYATGCCCWRARRGADPSPRGLHWRRRVRLFSSWSVSAFLKQQLPSNGEKNHP